MRTCKGCGFTGDIELFEKCSTGKDGRRNRCKRCAVAKARGWQVSNPERFAGNGLRWKAEHPEKAQDIRRGVYARNREKVCAASREWYWNNAERAKAAAMERYFRDPQRSRERNREWARRNPERAKAIRLVATRQYIARKKSAPGDGVSVNQWLDRISEFNGCCAYCVVESAVLDMEHMDPLSRGGHHDIANVVPSCKVCNSRKGTLSVLEFLTGFRLDGRAQRKVG